MMKSVIPLILTALLLGGCGDDATTPSATANTEELPANDVIYGVHQVMTKNGVRTGVVDSDTAYMRSSQTFDLRVVHITFFNDNGTESGTLTAETGEYSGGSGSFVARGNAVLITKGPDPRRIESEELHYDVKADLLWTDKPFVMHEGEQVTKGQSFRSDSKFQAFTVTGATTTGGLPRGATGSGPTDLSF
jgi:LPS export ABC transporter protein LptC